jgi:DNA-binding CsgD family transcriptional regulator
MAVLVPALAAAAVTAGVPGPARAAAGMPKLSDEEAAYCAEELDVVERREELFASQGLSQGEIARRNEAQLRAVNECRDRYRAQQRRASEHKEDLEEVQRRAGPNATEKEREQAWREIRRERLASKPTSQLTPEEKAELAAGMQDEVDATHAALDHAHAQDPAFMQIVYSALSCYHGDRKAEIQDQIASEEALLRVGTGDRQRLYALKSELRQSEDVLQRTREASAGRALERCSSGSIPVIAHCMGLRFQGRRADAMCESEQIQQYVRLVK